MSNNEVAIIIPARISSTRLPNKPLAKISDRNLIQHVLLQVQKLNYNHIYVATDSQEIADSVKEVGGKFIITTEDCPSGTDRVFAAYNQMMEKNDIKYVINLQGDMPFVNADIINEIVDKLKGNNYDIVTPVMRVKSTDFQQPSNVKVVINKLDEAMYFSRSPIPYDAKEYLYHIGIYGFCTKSLEKFVNLEQSDYERCENLEQLRALNHGMKIGICFANTVPMSVDTMEDLEKARAYYLRNK